MVILITNKQQPLETIHVDTCSNLNDGDNYGCLVVPRASVEPVWNNVVSWDKMVSLPGTVEATVTAHIHTWGNQPNEANLCWYDLPWVIYVSSASSSLSCLPLLHPDWVYCRNTKEVKRSCTGLMCEKTVCSVSSSYPDHINKSALWTSASACIMDDIAEGPARQRGWVPGRDNEPPFGHGKCVEALLTNISNLSASDTNLQ